VNGRSVLVFAAFLFVACTRDSAPTVASGSISQLTATFAMPAPDAVFLLEVDDAPTTDATSLRSTVASMLRPTVEYIADSGNWYDPARNDPAAWHPVSLHVVLVFPSSPDSSRAFGPSDDARLALVAPDSSLDQVDAVADAVADDLEAHVAPVDAPYLPIDAAMQTLELFAGVRPPSDAHELALVASLGSAKHAVAMSVVSPRDDEGSDVAAADAELATLLTPPFTTHGAVFTSTVAPALSDCTVWRDTSTRLGQWVNASAYLALVAWPCAAGAEGPATLLANALTDYGSEDCPPTPLTSCVLTWSTPTLTACDPALGLADPLDPDGVRRPATTTVDGVEQRVCEMHALAGSDLAACETSLTCDGCAPGWCRTELRFAQSGECPSGGYAFRFIGAAAMRGEAELGITCDVGP
jgi:hypothetical protein